MAKCPPPKNVLVHGYLCLWVHIYMKLPFTVREVQKQPVWLASHPICFFLAVAPWSCTNVFKHKPGTKGGGGIAIFENRSGLLTPTGPRAKANFAAIWAPFEIGMNSGSGLGWGCSPLKFKIFSNPSYPLLMVRKWSRDELYEVSTKLKVF